MLNKKMKLGLAALFACSVLSSANASVLDTFNYDMSMYVDGQTTSLTVGATTIVLPAQSTDTATEAVLLGQVDYTLNLDGDPVSGFGNNLTANANTIDQNLVFSAASGVSGHIDLLYHNTVLDALPPGNGVDLTEGGINDAIYIDVVSADQGLDIALAITDMSNVVSTLMFNVASGIANERLYLQFASFLGSADITDVKSVGATITSGNSADFTLAEVGTIPEPTTLAIFGLGLLGFAASRRNKAQ